MDLNIYRVTHDIRWWCGGSVQQRVVVGGFGVLGGLPRRT